MRSLWEFFKDGGWLGMASDVGALISTGVSLWEHINDKPISAYSCLFLSVILACIGGYSAWHKKREALTDEQAKQGRPVLTASFVPLGGERPQFRLRLQNSSTFPAVGVHIDDVRNGSKVLRFFPPESVVGVGGNVISCQILENGWQEKDNVAALFETDRMMQVFEGMCSQVVPMRILFLNFDNKAAQKCWVLSFPFWFDYQQQLIVMGAQSVEELTHLPR